MNVRALGAERIAGPCPRAVSGRPDLWYHRRAVWYLAAAYLAIVLAGGILLFGGSETKLLRGERVLGLTAVFVLAALVLVAIRWARPAPGVVAFWAVSLTCSLLIRGKWILVHYDPRVTPGVLEGALAMLLIPSERAGPCYALKLGDRAASVCFRPIAPGIALLTFAASEGHKKAHLLRVLLAKRFRPVFPRPTIDLR